MQDLAFARSAPAIDDGEPDAARHGPPLQSLGSADSAGLLDMLDRLELLGSEQQFRDLLDGPMQGLLPHRGLVCATEAWPFAPAADPPRCRLLHGLPAEGLASLRLAGGTLRPVLTERWLHTRKPVLVARRGQPRACRGPRAGSRAAGRPAADGGFAAAAAALIVR